MVEETSALSRMRLRIGLLGSLFSIALVIFLGYLTFVFYVAIFVPDTGTFSLLAFAVVAGVATFFNPCAFPLLPGYLAHEVKVNPERGRQEVGPLLYGGSVAALGVTTFNLLLGGFLAVLGVAFLGSLALASPEPNVGVRVFRGVVGLLLIALGVSHATGRGLSFAFLERLGHRFRSFESPSPTRQLYVYGLGYNAVGIGCGGPILAGLAVFAFAFGGSGATLVAFLVFSLTMASLMIGVSVLPALVPRTSLRGLSRSTRGIQRVAGTVQAFIGLFLLFSSVYTSLFVQTFFPA
ncbi:MAG: cytochrome c biogenesis protein CcdA [Thermoplasmata archaeon]